MDWSSRGACPSPASLPRRWGGVLVWPTAISQGIDSDNEQARLQALDSSLTTIQIPHEDKISPL